MIDFIIQLKQILMEIYGFQVYLSLNLYLLKSWKVEKWFYDDAIVKLSPDGEILFEKSVHKFL